MTIIPLWAKALAVAIAIALVGLAIHRLDLSRQEIGYQRAVAEYNVKLIAAQADARAQEVAWQSKQKLEQEKTNEQINARDAQYAAAVGTIGGLRNTLTNLGNGLPTITTAACSARIAALSAVFGECVERYAEMGRAAQGQLIDAVACRKAWPE